MNATRLTPAKVRDYRYSPTGPAIQRLWDAQCPGLGVQAYKSGRRSWIFRYRTNGKQRIVTLGDVSDLQLEEAREQGTGIRKSLRKGVDPKAAQEAAEALPDPDTSPVTLGQLFTAYKQTSNWTGASDSFRSNLSSTFKVYLSDWADRPLGDITRREIRMAVDGLIAQGKDGAARGLLNRARILFNFALEMEYLEASPADHIKVKYGTSGKREHYLETADQLRVVWYFDGPLQIRNLVRWALLTGCRRDEARLATHDQFGDGLWTVTGTKTGSPLVLPVMPLMQQVIDEQQKTFPDVPHLFPSTSSNLKPIPPGTLGWHISEKKVGFSMHVLRHTVTSWMRELGIGVEVRELVTNHAGTGTNRAIYSHGDALKLKREALEQWHAKLTEALDLELTMADNVSYLPPMERRG